MLDFLRSLFSSKTILKDKSFPGIIAVKVIGVEKHPNADRLRIIKLDTGREEIYPVVCGAFNFDIGAIVVLALPGASIPQNIHSETHEPFILEKTKIRGIESQGMVCAAFELGLSTEPGKGIMLLKDDTTLGQEFNQKMIKTL